jgi:hypothetical protein
MGGIDRIRFRVKHLSDGDMKTIIVTPVLGLFAYGEIGAANLTQIYRDGARNIDVVTLEGLDIQLTTAGRGTRAKLLPYGETAAWIVSATGTGQDKMDAVGSELAVYRKGTVRSIKCEPLIREYRFWQKGNRIAIDCGGSHFAGREILFDVATLKTLASFEQADVPTEKRPRWSASSDQFSPDE